MTLKACLLALVLSVGFLTDGTGAPHPTCAPRDVQTKWLAQSHKETPVGRGVTASGNLVEVYASPDGASWTLLATDPRKISCIIGAGVAWRHLEAAPQEPDL